VNEKKNKNKYNGMRLNALRHREFCKSCNGEEKKVVLANVIHTV
jgi:hypothetical protein